MTGPPSGQAAHAPDVLVIGLGIAGAMTALRLQRAGLRVLAIDREGPAAGCSSGNGGAIGQNICAPFTQPGLLRQIPGWYLDPDGPVVVHPAWLLKSVPWIVRWLQASSEASTYHAARAMAFLHHDCLGLYRAALGNRLYGDLIRDTGYLYVYETPAPGKGELFAQRLREDLGIPSRPLSRAEVVEMEPALAGDFQRGLLLPGNSFTPNPRRLVETVFDLFRQAGGSFLRATVQDLRHDGRKVVAVETDQGVVTPGHVVICAGIRSGPLARMLGVNVPLVSERGYHIRFPESPVRLNYKVMNASRGFGATSMEDGLQVSGTVELTDADTPPNWRRAEALARNARRLFGNERIGENFDRWAGDRPSLPDSLPVVERVPHLSNAWLNFGHSHWGLSGAPRSAEIIADLIAGAPVPEAVRAFSSARFRFGSRKVTLDDPRCSRKASGPEAQMEEVQE